jgi:imidazolonepropionase-like amidohydrolase
MIPYKARRTTARIPDGDTLRAALGVAVALGAVLHAPTLAAQSTTPPSQEGVFFLAGGNVVTMAGPVLEGANVLLRDGRIAAVGRDVRAPEGAIRIDATGRHLYPGLIDSQTGLGLAEMTPESDDRVEMGRFTPHLRTISSVNAHSNGIPLARSNGVTTVISQPAGGTIPGPAALIQLDGWTWEELALRPEAAMLVNYPRLRTPPDEWGGSASSEAEFEAQVAELRAFLQEARTYEGARSRGTRSRDLPLEAMRPVIRGELPLLIRADGAEEIRSAIELTEQLGLRMILAGGREAWKVADVLAAKGIPVVLGSVLRMPDFDEPYDVIFAQPSVLHRAGVRFAFSTGSTSMVRNLPYHAGMATAYGLPPEAALRALTLSPAEIWGMADELGSIEVGKRANLLIADGDILDVRTKVLEVFVDGRRASPDHRHLRLYKNFSDRPPS